MDGLSKDEIEKILSLKTKPVPNAASLRFRRFAGLYSKDTAADPACSLTQDEVDKAFAVRDSAGDHQ
jgi:hypothetical protein